MSARRPFTWLLAGALAALAGPALADSRVVQGQGLVLTTNLSETISVSLDPTLSGAVRLSRDDGLDCVSVNGGSSIVVGTGRCDSDIEGLSIAVAPGTAITLEITGSGNVQLGDLPGANLVATINGSGDLKGGQIGQLTLAVHGSGDTYFSAATGPVAITSQGSGDIRLGKLGGVLSLRQFGSGDVAIGAIDASAVDVEGASSGDLMIGGGAINALRARRSGTGDMVVAATVEVADVTARGGGDIKLGVVHGTVQRNASGGSDIVIGGPAVLNTIEREVARAAADPDHRHVVTIGSGPWSMIKHFVTIGVVIAALVMIVRVVRRSGAMPAVKRRVFGGPPPPPAPLHPGVQALAELMARLDQKLGRVESYVTQSEFELHQKFRELK